jgi:hypothetical protein
MSATSSIDSSAALATRILSDDAGNASSTRLAMLMALAVVMVVWAVVSIYRNDLQPIPESVVTLLTILIVGKVAQKKLCEASSPIADPTATPPPANPPTNS